MKSELEKQFRKISALQKKLQKNRNALLLAIDNKKLELLKRSTPNPYPISARHSHKSKSKKKTKANKTKQDKQNIQINVKGNHHKRNLSIPLILKKRREDYISSQLYQTEQSLSKQNLLCQQRLPIRKMQSKKPKYFQQILIPDARQDRQLVINFNKTFTWDIRAIIINWILLAGSQLAISRQSVHAAIRIFDQFIGRNKKQIQKQKLQNYALTCLYLGSKLEQIYPLTIRQLNDYGMEQAPQLLELQIEVIKTLQCRIIFPNLLTRCQTAAASWLLFQQSHSLHHKSIKLTMLMRLSQLCDCQVIQGSHYVLGINKVAVILLYLVVQQLSYDNQFNKLFDRFSRLCFNIGFDQIMFQIQNRKCLLQLQSALVNSKCRGQAQNVSKQNTQVWIDQTLKIAKQLHSTK